MATILVADDHDAARSVFCSVLRGARHEVIEAADPRIRVLAVSAGWHLKLPTAGGGVSQGDVRQDVWAAGADGTISKPLDHRFLLAEVDRLVRERPLDG